MNCPILSIVTAALVLVACSGTRPAGGAPGGGGGSGDAGSGGGAGTGGSGGTGGAAGFGGTGVARCGDGVVDPGEACDDGNAVDGDCCTNRCTVPPSPVCGDGVVGCGEGCDDGNEVAWDGCSACRVECRTDQQCDGDAGESCVKQGLEGLALCTVDERRCSSDTECRQLAPDRCPTPESCYCNGDGDGTAQGVCWQVRSWFDHCSTDEECGSAVYFDRPAACLAMSCSSAESTRLCVPLDLPGRTCPPMLAAGAADDPRGDLAGYCVPQAGCGPPEPCYADADCRDPALPVCDLARQICVPGCVVNVESDETVGCPPAKPACHAMPEQLDPNLLGTCWTAPAYGVGKCGLECQADVDCAHRGTDVNGEPYVCRERGGRNTCAPKGCIDDAECPEGPGLYPGYCDPFTEACVYDRCRLGPDPRAGCGVEEPYPDCAPGFACTADSSGGDTGTCAAVTR